MKHTFIHLGCEVNIADTKVTICKPDRSIEKFTLKIISDCDTAEEFVREYLALSIVKQ
jgi:hypothetical protein